MNKITQEARKRQTVVNWQNEKGKVMPVGNIKQRETVVQTIRWNIAVPKGEVASAS